MPGPGPTSRCISSDSAPTPDGVLPARGPLADRTSTKRNRPHPGRRRLSPGFLALRLAPIGRLVTVLGSDLSDHVRQFILSPCGAKDDAALPVEHERHTISFTEAGLFGYR